MIDRVKLAWHQARIHGLLVQSMANRAGAQELRVVVEHDPVFGPLIMLGEGGVEWRAEDQAAVALPPLNMNLPPTPKRNRTMFKPLALAAAVLSKPS